MRLHKYLTCILLAAPAVFGQDYGTIRGKVILQATGDPLAGVTVLASPVARTAKSRADGTYEITGVAPGKYEVMAHMHPLADARHTVEVAAGAASVVDFSLAVAAIHEEITITAAGREQLPLETFQSVASLELADLAPRAAASLGEVLEGEAGVAKRSYGPGSSRPIIRGFDGDRVLILQDGMPSGTLSSQSGDHGEPVDVSTIERVEIVRGPATLLYGTNAIGGVVNVITEHHQEHEHAHPGVRGFLTGSGGTNGAQAGGGAGFEAGFGKWLLFASGGASRTGDYSTPIGKILNSQTHGKNTAASLARFGDAGFLRFNYGVQDGNYGVPFHVHHHDEAEEAAGHEEEEEGPVVLRWRRQNARLSGGINNLGGGIDKLALNLDFSDWHHREIAGGILGTEFFNRQYTYRATFNQRPARGLLGSFGVNGLRRSYRVRGDEQITPNVTQTSFAGFGLEEVQLRRFRLQFGGRVETNRYAPAAGVKRTFTGFSGSAGVNAPLWENGVLVASYSDSYRAPAIEELYNYGPHHGNMAFEVGDPRLQRERSRGVEIGLRHRTARVHAEANFFRYGLDNFVYLSPTAESEHGLVVAEYVQASSRYVGGEGLLHVGLHPSVWLNLGLDAVDAQLTAGGVSLPRIPPLRGRIGVEARYRDLALQPELVLVARQNHLYYNETATSGYALLNLTSSYTVNRRNGLHIISVNLFNAGDRLYRNHASLIKAYAPEMGRGLRVAYTVRFF